MQAFAGESSTPVRNTNNMMVNDVMMSYVPKYKWKSGRKLQKICLIVTLIFNQMEKQPGTCSRVIISSSAAEVAHAVARRAASESVFSAARFHVHVHEWKRRKMGFRFEPHGTKCSGNGLCGWMMTYVKHVTQSHGFHIHTGTQENTMDRGWEIHGTYIRGAERRPLFTGTCAARCDPPCRRPRAALTTDTSFPRGDEDIRSVWSDVETVMSLKLQAPRGVFLWLSVYIH